MTATAESLNARTIGPYRVLHEIGRGGMGVVYRAVHAEGGPVVALKMPNAELSDLFGSMRREIHALSRLRHPGIVRILDEGVEKGVPWYAMELLEARSMDEVLGIISPVEALTAPSGSGSSYTGQVRVSGTLPLRDDLPRALTLMYRLARVLAYVHVHGIVHRDLKPENVLVRAGDRPVLVDFGLMGQFHARSGREVLEVGGMAFGTALYLSPEQARGELVDARADLYSIGIMLYEIVTGRPPFEAESVGDLLRMHITDPPVPPSELVDGVSPALERLILHLLEKQRGARLGYAEDVATLLVEAGATPDPDADVETAAYLYRPEIVGRKGTLDSLYARLPEARKGKGGLVLLGGVSGIGKTAVAAMVAREAMIRYFQVVTGESDPIGGQPLHPLRPLLRQIADFCRGQKELTARVLGVRLPVLREVEPAIASLADDDAPRIPAAIVSRRLNADLADTLAAFAREQPLLLVLDDLQWADEITLRFLASLGPDFFEGLPLIILGTYRADEAGTDLRALLAQPHASKVMLNRLDDADVGQIVRSMLAAPDAPARFLEFLAAQTEGNPFFIAEYLRSAVAEDLLYRERGHWKVASREETYASLGLPGTIRDLVAHRLDRLTPVAQRIAEATAVLGREATEPQLVALAGESDLDTLEALAELVEQHVFEPTHDGVRFAHDKLREGAYARIDDEQRGMLHGRAVELIEKSCTSEEELTRHAAELARHCDVAGFSEKAVGYYARAAEASVASGACREAIEQMNRAAALDKTRARAASVSSARRSSVRHAKWERVLTFAHFGLGDLPGSAEHARTSLARVGVRLPETETGWRLRLLTETLKHTVHFVVPPRLLRRAARLPVLREIALSAQKFSEGLYYVDEKTTMLATGLIAVSAAERVGDLPVLVHSYAHFGGALTSGPAFHRLARHYFDKARRIAIETRNLPGLAHLGYVSAILYITTCDWKSCERHFPDALAAAKQTGDHQLIEMNEMAGGLFEMYMGKFPTSIATFTGIRDRAHKRFNRQHEAWGHSWRAINLVWMDRGEEALDALASAIDVVKMLGDNALLVSQAHRCTALLHLDRMDEAIEAADVTYAMVSRIPALIWEKYRGLSAPAEVYLDAARFAKPEEAERMRHAAGVLLKRLEPISRRMPVARPVTLRLMGIREILEGNPRNGEKLLRKSIATAVRLALPLDEAIGEYELARWVRAGDTETHRVRARAIFEQIGCELYLRKLNEREGA